MNSKNSTRLLVTGSRDFTDRALVDLALDAVVTSFLLGISRGGPLTLVHGGARGLDFLAHQSWAEEQRGGAEAHFAQWGKHTDQCPAWDQGQPTCKLAGARRNQEMLDAGADVCLAFPLSPQSARGKNTSRGTWDMATRARDAGVPTFVVWRESLFAFGQPAQTLLDREVARLGLTVEEHGSVPLRQLIIPF